MYLRLCSLAHFPSSTSRRAKLRRTDRKVLSMKVVRWHPLCVLVVVFLIWCGCFLGLMFFCTDVFLCGLVFCYGGLFVAWCFLQCCWCVCVCLCPVLDCLWHAIFLHWCFVFVVFVFVCVFVCCCFLWWYYCVLGFVVCQRFCSLVLFVSGAPVDKYFFLDFNGVLVFFFQCWCFCMVVFFSATLSRCWCFCVMHHWICCALHSIQLTNCANEFWLLGISQTAQCNSQLDCGHPIVGCPG